MGTGQSRDDKAVCFLNSFLSLPDREMLVVAPNTLKSSCLHVGFGDRHRSDFIIAPFFLKYDLGEGRAVADYRSGL